MIEFYDEDSGTTIFIEESGKSGFQNANAGDIIKGKLYESLQSLKSFGDGVLKTVQGLKPDEVEVKVGLKLELREGKLIGLIAHAGAETNFEVTLKWQKDSEKLKTKGS